MFYFLFIATVLGLTAGFSPGPLMTVVISETLKHGRVAGIKVALAPIFSDLPLVLFSIFILSKLENFHFVLGLISISGAIFLFYMGFENLRTLAPEVAIDDKPPSSIKKGILTNLLNPQPYVFWFTVGAPIMHKAIQHSWLAPTIFIGVFYFLLIGAKILMTYIIERSSQFMQGKSYLNIMRGLGLFLWVLSLMLFIDGLNYLGVIDL